jgi:isoleucyl-tRNA synthetase
MYLLLDAITRLIAPVLTFTADEIWTQMPGEREESVHLASFPQLMDQRYDAELEARYGQIQKVRAEVSKLLEKARAEKQLGQSLEAKVALQAPESVKALLEDYRGQLASLFIVSQVELVDDLSEGIEAEQLPGLKLKVQPADGEKCERCWNFATTIGANSEHPSICGRCADALSAE